MAFPAVRRLAARPALGTVVAVAIIVVYCISRYRDSILGFFFLDDFWLLRNAAQINIRSLWDVGEFFRPDHTGFQLYRPLTHVGYFYMLRQLFGYDPSAYHAVQLLAYTLNAVLVFGIARRLTESRAAGLSVAIMYAAAPGHGAAVYWMAAFTTIGTALIVFSMLWWWLRTDGLLRVAGCTILQVLGLLASEHAVVGPVLLALVALFAPRREPWRHTARQLVAPVLVVGSYLALKLWYLTAVRPFKMGSGYVPSLDVGGWALRLGEYADACFNALTMLNPGARGHWILGAFLVVLTAFACWRSLRGAQQWRLLAVGGAIFVVSLLPVLPLRNHYYDYYIGIAAMGAALAVVGVCRLGSRHWQGLAVALALGIVVLDVVTEQRVTRSDPVVRLVRAGAYNAAGWLLLVQRRASLRGDGLEMLVPKVPATTYLFEMGQAERFFLTTPPRISLYKPAKRPARRPGRIVLRGAPPRVRPGQSLPGWKPRWDWLRRFAGKG